MRVPFHVARRWEQKFKRPRCSFSRIHWGVLLCKCSCRRFGSAAPDLPPAASVPLHLPPWVPSSSDFCPPLSALLPVCPEERGPAPEIFHGKVNMLTGSVMLQVMIAFEDLAVYFTWEEWQNMNNAQKILYRDVMLETYSSLFSLGHCITKPDLIFKLEQGEEPWMVDKCLNQSLSVVMKMDDLIKINLESQDKNLNQDFMKNNKTSAHKRVELRKTLSLNSSHIPTMIIKKGIYSGLNPEECNKCHTVYPHSGPDQLQAGEKFDNTKIPGKSLHFCEPLSQYDNIHIMKQPFGPTGQAKVFTRKMFCKSERVHMAENCNKSTVTFGKTTQIEKAIHENSSLNMHQQTHTRKKFYKYIKYVEPVIHQSHLTINHRLNTREKLYTCNPCGKSLSINSPYECNDSGKDFGQKSVLRKCQQIHTGEKSHECSDCGKAFTQKSYLINHQRIHTGEKLYKCFHFWLAHFPLDT
ncbi:zinc finger protein 717-like [Lepus europaeus]|uniref:zinc finger protein 717-like n=1 Tax=Lepus europaeus TaxID=9983 RepID=UPI002B45C88E|nr:zinc finger protein 717-like [Lepus europaeus]